RLLSKGGMAAVYLAEHELLQKTIALKILPANLGADESYVERFLREARAAASLDHPHIIRIHDVGRSDGIYYIAMDLIEGPTLKAVIQERAPLPLTEILKISDQVLAALSLAHGRHIIHRDLKPQNIMFGRQEEVVVMDFGIAKAADDVDLTRTGMFIGTARYASPEQIKGGKVDARSDLYAWALVMFEMATGRRPERFKAPKTEVLHQEMPAPLATVVARALSMKPDDRYASADDMRAALSALAEPAPRRGPLSAALPPETLNDLQLPTNQATVQATVVSPGAQPRSSRRRKRPLALIIAGVSLVLAAAGWWLTVTLPDLQRSPTATIDAPEDVSMAAQDLSVWSDKPTYRVGEKLHLYYRSTRDGYLFLFHQSADGDTQQIFPLHSDDDNFISAQLTYTLPDPSHNFNYVASPPVGQERILAHMIEGRDEALAWQAKLAEGVSPPPEALTEKLVLTIVQ
ncbi:MAG: serine/threonine-protein kinase, partial [Desulfosarcinaceae bacterium]